MQLPENKQRQRFTAGAFFPETAWPESFAVAPQANSIISAQGLVQGWDLNWWGLEFMVEKCRNNGIMGLGNQDKGGFSPSFTFGGFK
ncbi:MAG: hypothetical protein K2O03_13920 [Lachnospiraceae bacterium]|nr:hypothetical protein [Lachnospiraceae bacterium]